MRRRVGSNRGGKASSDYLASCVPSTCTVGTLFLLPLLLLLRTSSLFPGLVIIYGRKQLRPLRAFVLFLKNFS